jgi:transcriptional regulator with XRE-family HTH domain
MSFEVDAARLRLEMARRGLSASELARAARLSPQTVGAALAGHAISASSLRLIAKALTESPVLATIDVLLRAREGVNEIG